MVLVRLFDPRIPSDHQDSIFNGVKCHNNFYNIVVNPLMDLKVSFIFDSM